MSKWSGQSSGGGGGIAGPASSTDNAIARFDGTGGSTLQNSSASIDDSGNLTATNFSGTHSGTSSGTNTGDFNPQTSSFLYYDFDQHTALTWVEFSNGTGATIDKAAGATANHPGIWTLTTGTTTTGVSVTRYGSAAIVITGGAIIFELDVRIPTLSASGQEFRVDAGLTDATDGTAPSSGIYFCYDRATDGDFWSIKARNSAGTVTKVVSSIAVVGNTWYRLRMSINAAGTSASGTVDGVSVGSALATNLPDVNDQIFPMIQIAKTSGTTTRSIQIDYWYSQLTFTTAR